MKTLIIIRHAKAEQALKKDADRELTPRGHRNAGQTAERLKEKGYRIDKLLTSNSSRTTQTTAHLAAALGIPEENIVVTKDLYLAGVLDIVTVIEEHGSGENTIAVVGHNPGVSDFVIELTGSIIGSLPTSGVAVIRTDADSWSGFAASKKIFVETFSPKDPD